MDNVDQEDFSLQIEFCNFLKKEKSSPIMCNQLKLWLCSGTWLMANHFVLHVIENIVLTRCTKAEDAVIFSIPFVPVDVSLLFRRFQLPVNLSSAMSINKSQGPNINSCWSAPSEILLFSWPVLCRIFRNEKTS